MARPIKETPILFGDDARRFEARMKEKRHETPEQREERLYHYRIVCEMMKRGEEINRQRALAREQESFRNSLSHTKLMLASKVQAFRLFLQFEL